MALVATVTAIAAAGLGATAGGTSAAVSVAIPSPVASAPTWVHQLGSPKTDTGQQVAVDAAGNAYVLGESDDHLAQAPQGESGVVFIAKYARGGARQWAAHYGPDGTFESRATIDVAPSGCLPGAALDRFGDLYYSAGVVVSGGLTGPSAAVLVRVDPSGAVAWTRELSGSNSVVGSSARRSRSTPAATSPSRAERRRRFQALPT